MSGTTLGKQCQSDGRSLGPSKREIRPPKWMSDYIGDYFSLEIECDKHVELLISVVIR